MKAKIYQSLVLITGLMAVAVTAHASEFTVDPSHSKVSFTVRHIVSKVTGEFKDFDGKFSFDEKKPADSKVSFNIKTASINTNTEKRDAHLKSPDFFDAEKNPALTFVSKKVAAAGKNKFKVEGDLSMHGVTKPTTFTVEYLGQGNDPWGGTRAGFTANSKIHRKDFGLTWNKTLDNGGLLISEDVDINLEVEATLDKPAAAEGAAK